MFIKISLLADTGYVKITSFSLIWRAHCITESQTKGRYFHHKSITFLTDTDVCMFSICKKGEKKENYLSHPCFKCNGSSTLDFSQGMQSMIFIANHQTSVFIFSLKEDM